MNILRSLSHVVSAALLLGSAQIAAAETVSISGAVLKPGTYQWHANARLHDATVAGQVRADAWFLGAALLRQSALEPQQRLKAGVLFELRVNRLHARTENNPALYTLLEEFTQQVQDMPVTGRVPAELNPLQLMIQSRNPLLEPGDQLVYPTRPDHVRVLGAVQAPCMLAFDVQAQLRDYLRQCPAHAAADKDQVFVIQPDGRVQEVGIAAWNAQPVNIAVGAVIYRPVSSAVLSPETPGFNRDVAELLATQYRLGGRFSE